MTTYAEGMQAVSAYRRQIEALHREKQKAQAAVTPQAVDDYVFAGWDGPVRLSQLFGDKDDLFVIHNMGKGCAYCTLWADGFNGVYPHLADRAAFVVSSPNTPDVQKAFAAGRGWRFPMVSHQGTTFADDMGYRRQEGWYPGVSVFKRDGEKVVRVSDAELGPGDDFCLVWHMFDLMPRGAAGWEPKFAYPAQAS